MMEEWVASVFDRHNIVSDGDLRDAAKRLTVVSVN